MTPATHDLEFYAGDTVQRRFQWKPGGQSLDLTGYTARMQFRRSPDADAADFEASTAGGELAIEQDAGTGEWWIKLALDPAQVPQLLGRYSGAYDLELTAPDGTVTTILAGRVSVRPDVSRD